MEPEQPTEPELDLPIPDADPAGEAALRSAFHTLPIARRMSFHEAMAVPMWEICIRNTACAIEQRRKGARP